MPGLAGCASERLADRSGTRATCAARRCAHRSGAGVAAAAATAAGATAAGRAAAAAAAGAAVAGAPRRIHAARAEHDPRAPGAPAPPRCRRRSCARWPDCPAGCGTPSSSSCRRDRRRADRARPACTPAVRRWARRSCLVEARRVDCRTPRCQGHAARGVRRTHQQDRSCERVDMRSSSVELRAFFDPHEDLLVVDVGARREHHRRMRIGRRLVARHRQHQALLGRRAG